MPQSGMRQSGYSQEDEPQMQQDAGRTQASMWREFNEHFRKKDRPQAKVNHHDFIDASFLAKMKKQNSRRFFSQVGGQSLDKAPPQTADSARTDPARLVDLGRHRLH